MSLLLKSIPKSSFVKLKGFRLTHSQPKDFPLPSRAKEARIKIGDQYIRYVTVGHGAHNVICIPAGVGTIWTDFKPQVEGFDVERFTLITFDLPGFGKSTPPLKTYPLNFHEKDADITHEFLQTLGLKRYSLLGWCYGGVVSLIYAAKYAHLVNKLVTWGTGSFLLPQDLENFTKLLDISSWSPCIMQPRVDVYGEQLLAENWRNLINAMNRRFMEKKGDLCTPFLEHIKCPTYILHGAKDIIVDESHVSFLKKHIKNSRTYTYPEGNHNIHLRYADDFNKKIQEFLLEDEKSIYIN